MKTFLKLVLAACLVGAAAATSYEPAMAYWKKRNLVEWETVEVRRGNLKAYVNSTGTIKPVLSASVGSFVSGPVVELNVDFNDAVTKDQILARVDPQLSNAAIDRDKANLATREADVERIEAQLQQSLNNFKRSSRLREKNPDFVSDREMDALVFEVKSLQAQRKLGLPSIKQAKAALETSLANLKYCEIKSTVDGVVIERKIDHGQTLAA
jgi:HlyD family secretion protein